MVFVSLLAAIAVILVAALRTDDRARGAEAGVPHAPHRRPPVLHRHARGAEWVASEENVDEDAAWIGIGYIVTDVGLLLLIVVTVLAGLAKRRVGRGTEPGGLVRPATAITLLLIAAYAVALWAMTAKPV